MLIYLDYNATTPLDERVFAAMEPFFREKFGNAASPHHRAGREARDAVERAREQFATALGADPREVIWTSGATEADNLAIKGVAAAPAYSGRRHVVTVRTEHKAVLDPCRWLESTGYEVTLLGVDRVGRIDLDELAATIRDDTLLVSVMHGNNETGVLQPIAEVGALCHDRGVLFHTDATQTLGKEPLDVGTQNIDLLSCSAHKLYGPKGAGALYVRRKGPRVRCEPLLHGGGHERGLRAGTLDVPGIVGFGAAVELCMTLMETEQPRIRRLRDRLETRLVGDTGECLVNGGTSPRLAGTLNVSFPGVDAETLIEACPDIAMSTASACTSATLLPSYVLAALGLSDDEVRGSIRLSLGRFTTEADVDTAADGIVAAVERQRRGR